MNLLFDSAVPSYNFLFDHGVEYNIDLSLIETITSSEDLRLRQFKRRTSSEPLEIPSEIIVDVSNIN